MIANSIISTNLVPFNGQDYKKHKRPGKVDSWHYKFFFFHLYFWIWKVWKEPQITKTLISWERKELFQRNKKYFSQFLTGCHLMKKIENSGHKL